MPAPLAVKFVESPLQITESPPMLAVGNGLTVNACVAVAVQPVALVTVTAYVPVAVALMLAADEPVLHEYVPPPDAASAADVPLQMLLGPAIAATGGAMMAMDREAEAAQPFAPVTVTVYAPATAMMALAVVAPVLHEYDAPPEAVSAVGKPPHSPLGPAMAAVGAVLSVSDLVFVAGQPAALVTVTAYVPAAETLMTAVVSPVLHRYEAPPEAVSGALAPGQKLVAPAMLAVGLAPLPTDWLAVAVQPPASVAVTV